MRCPALAPAVLAAVLFALHCAAATISGRVRDGSGAAVPDALVELSGAVRRAVLADESGAFVFDGLPDGSYRARVVRAGFSEWERVVQTGQAVAVELVPSPVAAYVETASRIPELAVRVPFLLSGVNRDEVEKAGAVTLEDALRSVPGLQHGTQGNAFTRVATRGLRDTADTLVVMDGVPLRQLNGSADLTMVPVQSVQEVEFVKGPASAAYGRSAVGGVMQFFTTPPARRGRSGDIGFGLASFGHRETMGSASLPWRSGRLAASGQLQGADGFQEGVGRDMGAMTLMAEQTVAQRVNLRLHYFLSDVEATRGSIVPLVDGRPAFGVRREDSFGIPDARFDARLHSLTGRADASLSRDVILTHSTNFNRYDRFFTGGITILPPPTVATKGYFENAAVQDTWISDTMLNWRVSGDQLRSTFLGGFTHESGGQDQNSPNFTNAPTFRGPDWTTPVPGPNAANDPRGIRGPVTHSRFEQGIASLYLQERLEYGPFGTTLGLRWDRFDQSLRRSDTGTVAAHVRSRVSPRVGADAVVLDRGGASLVWFGNWVEGFRPQFPALSQQGGLIVPQLLRPEVTRSLESGLRVRSGRWFGQASYFDMKKTDGQRSFRSGPETFVFVNATTRVNGLEAELRSRIGAHTAWAHYAHHNARHIEFRPTLAADFSGFRLRMAPNHIAGAGAMVQILRNVTWSPAINFVGARPLRDNILNPQILPSYTLLSSAVSVDLKQVRFVFAATNLTDVYYIADDFSAQNAGNPGMPRRVSLQVRYRW
ncbi:MAG: TonB-dependent receptor [Bryobacterales bacterium]|nr:TonB-dependent receptor [Bryobacterales bacterium]